MLSRGSSYPLLGVCSQASGCDIKCLTANEAQTVMLTTFSLNMSTNSSKPFSVVLICTNYTVVFYLFIELQAHVFTYFVSLHTLCTLSMLGYEYKLAYRL